MAQFKGTVFIATRIFTEQTFGSDAFARCLSKVTPADRTVLDGISAVGWYPVEPVLRFLHVLEELHGRPGDYAISEQAGKFSAAWSLNTVLKFFVKFTSPHWLLTKHGSIWNRYHDTGRWEMDPEQPKRFAGRLHDFQVKDEAFCARLRGWLHGAAELTGGQEVRVLEPSCRCRGAAYCHFVTHWE
jgi:hypothetical protein